MMKKEYVVEFLHRVEQAINQSVICNVDIDFNGPFYRNEYWHVTGSLTAEKGEKYEILGKMYDFKGQFTLLQNSKTLDTTNWISYRDEEMFRQFENWGEIICPNPFEYYEVDLPNEL